MTTECKLLYDLLYTIYNEEEYETSFYYIIEKYHLDEELKNILSDIFLVKKDLELLKDVSFFTSERWGVKLVDRYKKLLKVEGISDFSETKYSSLKLLSVRSRSHLYATDKYVIKCYFKYKVADSYEENEFELQELLYNEGYAVPKLIESFTTRHYRCYVTKRVGESLDNILENSEEGLGEQKAKEVARLIIPILERIHRSGRYYIDFSLGNISLYKDHLYMLDFGATICMYDSCLNKRISRYTVRYASRCVLACEDYNSFDELESLGYVLLDIIYGHNDNPNSRYSLEARDNLWLKCLSMKGFLGDYFRAIKEGSMREIYKVLR